jgi:hypothetical protein
MAVGVRSSSIMRSSLRSISSRRRRISKRLSAEVMTLTGRKEACRGRRRDVLSVSDQDVAAMPRGRNRRSRPEDTHDRGPGQSARHSARFCLADWPWETQGQGPRRAALAGNQSPRAQDQDGGSCWLSVDAARLAARERPRGSDLLANATSMPCLGPGPDGPF